MAVVVVVLVLLSLVNVLFNLVFVFIPEALFHFLIPAWQWFAIAIVGSLLCWALAKS